MFANTVSNWLEEMHPSKRASQQPSLDMKVTLRAAQDCSPEASHAAALASVRALGALALLSSDFTSEVIALKVLPHMVRIVGLHPDRLDIAVAAAETLGGISKGNSTHRQAVLDSGALSTLIDSLSDASSHVRLLEASSVALGQLFRGRKQRTDEGEQIRAIKALDIILTSTSQENDASLRSAAAYAIGGIAAFTTSNPNRHSQVLYDRLLNVSRLVHVVELLTPASNPASHRDQVAQ